MKTNDDDTGQLPLLRSVLPDGYEAAQRVVDRLFGPDAVPDEPNDPVRAALHKWVSTLLAAEYSVEVGDDGIPRARATDDIRPRARRRKST